MPGCRPNIFTTNEHLCLEGSDTSSGSSGLHRASLLGITQASLIEMGCYGINEGEYFWFYTNCMGCS